MSKTERVNIIRERLEQAFQPDFLEVIDESDQHVGHAGHQGGNRHFAIKIKAKDLSGIPRVKAHQKIYSLFTDMMPEEIHALRIKILGCE